MPSGADAVASLRDDPRVAYVERDRTLRAAADPFDIIDPLSGPPPIKFTWAYDTVRAGEALATIGGGSSRVVSVIDTGLDVNHPEFAGQVARVFDTSSGGADVTDSVGHGTFVSGLISALDGNGIGGKGVAGTTKLLAVRASIDGSFTVGDLISGIEFSIRRGADVINMSLAGQGFTQTQARALEAAFFNDVLPIAAAGNNAENGNPVEFPAAAIGGRAGRARRRAVCGRHEARRQRGLLLEPQRVRERRRAGRQWRGLRVRRVLDSAGEHRNGVGQPAELLAGLQLVRRALRVRRGHELRVSDRLGPRRAGLAGGAPARVRAGGRGDGALGHRRRLERVHGRRRRRRQERRGHRRDVRRDRSEGKGQGPPPRQQGEGHRRADAGPHRPGDELAGRVSYGMLVSRDGGRSYGVIASRRSRPFSKNVKLRGRKRNVLVGTACDGNGNCGVKILGRFKRR